MSERESVCVSRERERAERECALARARARESREREFESLGEKVERAGRESLRERAHARTHTHHRLCHVGLHGLEVKRSNTMNGLSDLLSLAASLDTVR